jgi:hypothetical protein
MTISAPISFASAIGNCHQTTVNHQRSSPDRGEHTGMEIEARLALTMIPRKNTSLSPVTIGPDATERHGKLVKIL